MTATFIIADNKHTGDNSWVNSLLICQVESKHHVYIHEERHKHLLIPLGVWLFGFIVELLKLTEFITKTINKVFVAAWNKIFFR